MQTQPHCHPGECRDLEHAQLEIPEQVRDDKRKGNMQSFTGRYNCHNLVYYEEHIFITDAIAREKIIKNWPRAWKENLIARENPEWIFLNNTLFDHWPPDS